MTIGVKDHFVGDATNNSYIMEVDDHYAASHAVNDYTGDSVSLAGLNRSYDDYDGMGGAGDNLNGTAGNDALLYDTTGSAKDSDPAHYANIEQFLMGAGNDVLDLTSGTNGAASYAGANNLQGGAGNDVIWGGRGGELIVGDFNVTTGGSLPAGSDQLVGGGGNDSIFGDGRSVGKAVALGNDLIDGGPGNDLLFGDGQTFGADFTGSRGHNTFRFDGPGSGQDTIGAAPASNSFFPNGFQHGLDHLQLSPTYGYTASQALAHTSDTGAGGFALVNLGGGDSITLYGVHAADLDRSDFTIA